MPILRIQPRAGSHGGNRRCDMTKVTSASRNGKKLGLSWAEPERSTRAPILRSIAGDPEHVNRTLNPRSNWRPLERLDLPPKHLN